MKPFLERKKSTPIAMVTTYDYPTAKIVGETEVDILLVGDSLGPNMLGYNSVNEVTVSDMVHHIKAVRRGAPSSFILADLPWESIQTVEEALEAAKILTESGADSLKIEIERGREPILTALIKEEYLICSHIGYTPQTPDLPVTAQGKNLERAKELLELAHFCEKAGSFMLLMELIPDRLTKLITDSISIPTIGIGAGPFCDGQVQVIYDITGFSNRLFRHAKLFGDSSKVMKEAIELYAEEVHTKQFPTLDNCPTISEEFLEEVKESSYVS